MTITAESIQLAESGSAIYMLHWGEYDETSVYGPYLGVAGLDFSALAEEYRLDKYSAAEAAKEDHCWLGESEFVVWLLKKEILSSIATSRVDVVIRSSYDTAYVPKHWPECPQCKEGRGELEYGAVRQSLNRVATIRRCNSCQHEWDHHEQANNSSLPMLEDDGRDTQGACVPFAISKACNLPFKQVLSVCEKYGWQSTGLAPSKAIIAARELGYELAWQSRGGIGTAKPPTLKRLIAELPLNRNYIVGVKGHWLALVGGQVVDNDTNSGPARKVLELYEVKRIQALAA